MYATYNSRTGLVLIGDRANDRVVAYEAGS